MISEKKLDNGMYLKIKLSKKDIIDIIKELIKISK